MASYIPAKELNKRKDNYTEIKSTCDSISQLKSGSSWAIIGYSRKTEFESLTVIKEGLQWNILLQILPSNEVCYVFVRVEFGKMPGACYLIIWTGEEVSERKRVSVKENDKKILDLFSNYEGVIYASSNGNLNRQITENFKVNRTRHGSLKSSTFKKIQKPLKMTRFERASSMHIKTQNLQTSNFFLSNTEEKCSDPERKVSEQVIQEKLKSGEIIFIG